MDLAGDGHESSSSSDFDRESSTYFGSTDTEDNALFADNDHPIPAVSERDSSIPSHSDPVPLSSNPSASFSNGMDTISEFSQLSTLAGDAGFLVGVQDESGLQRSVMEKANQQLRENISKAERVRLEKTLKSKGDVVRQLNSMRTKLDSPRTKVSEKESLLKRISTAEKTLETLRQDENSIRKRLESGPEDFPDDNLGETERERLIRTGKITPFAQLDDLERLSTFTDKTSTHFLAGHDTRTTNFTHKDDMDDLDSEYQCSDSGDQDQTVRLDGNINSSSPTMNNETPNRDKDRYRDDGDESSYRRRYRKWAIERRKRKGKQPIGDEMDEEMMSRLDMDIDKEMFEPSIVYDDEELQGGYRIPGDVYSHLFPYQRTCVKWLWELYCQEVGGLIGDEMGLGKTIQIISFIAGLSYSQVLKGPVIVVCPATVLRQWVQEFHKWWPPLRVAILHSSGSGFGSQGVAGDSDLESASMSDTEEDIFSSDEDEPRKKKKSSSKRRSRTPRTKSVNTQSKTRALINKIVKDGHVLLTTYAAVRIHSKMLLPVKWGYCVLDEGHKIRNPDSEVTISCKRFKSPHRIILSGTPIQNNLMELWSLYDFVFPGRLGTLPVFQTQFSVPISLGGYANASNIQVQTAYKCACILRDLISPYMLRRMKSDVASDLPKKSEQVLFCRLSHIQRREYELFLSSKELAGILEGRLRVLAGIDVLRKICNHPDLLERSSTNRPADYGAVEKSGKMIVVKALLQMWKSQGHRVLLFSQTRQMLDILESFIRNEGYVFLRMDGTTPIQQRSRLVDSFNYDESRFVFLLTTKVGGLGINLTSANRVIIFDPDWNPSTDMQARERAWRLGQKKSVTIYRLMTSGTIEEKIYHRQIFKQFLTNKILKDPRQRRFFKSNDLHDLFVLGGQEETTTETGDLFGGINAEVHAENPSLSSSSRLENAPHQRKRLRARCDAGEELSTIQAIAKVDEYKPAAEATDANVDSDQEGSCRKGSDGETSRNPRKEESEGKSGHVANKRKASNDEDSRILQALFSKTGVHSALQHDVIMDASSPEALIVEREASKVADEAIAALKKSRRRIQHSRNNVGIPTWTGRNGSAGAPMAWSSSGRSSPSGNNKPKSAFGSSAMSSSSLLSGLRDRAGVGSGAKNTSDQSTRHASLATPSAFILPGSAFATAMASASSDSVTGEHEIDPTSQAGMIVQIRDRLASSGGAASTADIVASLKMRLSADSVPVFRKMLKGIAEFTKDERGVGLWRLKDEFM
ncbi:hypothetical protein BASA50_005546 [Batrachochytrium salamandrivorans]|uniref:DNA excision repair protein ERCC-6 n=1 Tax=Batrachochytrium salamandrivorans TaxID=1357716 RepID=A0ABQ8FCW1_9FUNG|nr:hypothetical protein BASA50_005546 [Batrachochytrium salamandrivorans]